MPNSDRTNSTISALPKNSIADLEELILPRRGWRDRQAFLKVLIKAKRALDIAEINEFLD